MTERSIPKIIADHWDFQYVQDPTGRGQRDFVFGMGGVFRGLSEAIEYVEANPIEPSDDLPEGYRWATEEEAERWDSIPGAIVVRRTHDSQGQQYTQGESDLAVPVARTDRAVPDEEYNRIVRNVELFIGPDPVL